MFLYAITLRINECFSQLTGVETNANTTSTEMKSRTNTTHVPGMSPCQRWTLRNMLFSGLTASQPKTQLSGKSKTTDVKYAQRKTMDLFSLVGISQGNSLMKLKFTRLRMFFYINFTCTYAKNMQFVANLRPVAAKLTQS